MGEQPSPLNFAEDLGYKFFVLGMNLVVDVLVVFTSVLPAFQCGQSSLGVSYYYVFRFLLPRVEKLQPLDLRGRLALHLDLWTRLLLGEN